MTIDPLSEKTEETAVANTHDGISAAHLQRLLDISMLLSSTLHLKNLLSLVMDVAIDLTDTETASILLVDKKSGELHFTASTDGFVPETTVVPLEGSIAGWVVRNNERLILDDVQADPRFYSGVDQNMQFVTRSMLAVPLRSNQGVIGALEVLNKRGDGRYTPQDLALMEALASQSAVAIMNAHLFQQSDLLAEIMHEIKTPLMAISSASELLHRPDLPADKHGELIGMIRRESQRLSQMTRDFLDFARLESGRIRLARRPVDVPTVITDVVHISTPQAAERGITITTNLDADMPTPQSSQRLVGDGDRLKQVLLNLVSNAVKYNKDGGQVAITAVVSDNTLQLSVADTGQGIEPQDMAHLFERFYRIPGSEHQEGSGLGLSVAKKIVEEHNGRIVVDSIWGEGTTFTITLPLTSAG